MFLVHSMIPDGGLTQATFEDMDALIADNFARATKANDIEQIVYLSGIIPKQEKTLSRHLKSRLEVERILGGQGVPVTTIRAGLIIGPEGSSFPILAKLVKRLPTMILPRWTKTETHPIDIREAVQALISVVGAESLYDRHIDIGGPEVMTYRKMIEQMAEVRDQRLEFRHLPESDIGLIAIHEFVPVLPWWFYTNTQAKAKAHLVVIWLFGRHVELLTKDGEDGNQVVEAPTN